MIDLILGAIVSAFTFSMLFAMLFSFLSNEFDFKKRQSYHIVTLLAFLCFMIFALHTTINAIISITSDHSFNSKWCVSKYMEMNAFAVGKLFAYYFFLIRLHQVFYGSVYAERKWKLKAISMLVTIPIISQSVVGYFWAIKNVESLQQNAHQLNVQQIDNFNDCTEYGYSIKTKIDPILLGINIALYLLTQLIYSAFILRTFVSKILLLSMPPKGSNSSLLSHDLLDIAMKTTNCVILLVASALVLVIKGKLFQVYWLNIEGLLTCLSIYLSFKFSTKYYNILFAPCHLWLHKPCVRCCFCCCLRRKLPNDIELQHHVETVNSDRKSQVANIEGIGVIANESAASIVV